MIIFGVDLATVTGCCDGEVGIKNPRLWSWWLADAGDSRPARLLMLRRFLVKYFETQPCDLVVYEAAMPIAVMVKMGATDDTVALLRGTVGVLEMTCEEHGKPVEAVPIQDARASVLGWRTNRKGSGETVRLRNGKVREETTKDRVIREVKALGVDCRNEHEADAAVVWQFACNRRVPRLAIEQTPLFRAAT